MILDINDGRITIEEEGRESFLKIQDKCPFNLCVSLKDGKYLVPYVSLPILVKTLNSVKYKVRYTDNLKKYHKEYLERRSILESLKGNTYNPNDPRFAKILMYIKKKEKQIKRHCKTFKGFYGNQIDSILYGIIGERIIIGNSIGTGKTLTSIMIAKYLMEECGHGKTIIMLPASLATNFFQDYNKYFNDKQMMLIKSETKKKRKCLYQTFKTTKRLKILLTNYEKCFFDYGSLKDLKFDILIVDEFHKMRNFREAKRSSNFFKLVSWYWKPEFRYPMSGTPIENKLFDLYPIFKLLDGGHILGGENFFDSNFIEYEEQTFRVYFTKDRYKLITKMVAIGFRHHEFVKKLISPFIIKKELDLPAGLYKNDVFIEPSKQFLDKYEKVKKSQVNPASRYATVRQFLCDTEREGWKDNPKFEELENILSQTKSKVVIFSFFKCSIRAIKAWLVANGYGCITCMGGDGKDALDVVNTFKSDPNLKCLITTDKINYGHNIQDAKIVIEWEKPIKPTTTMQRIGRCYRSGQDKDVHSYSFIVLKTIEETIYQQTELKKDVIEKVVESLGSGNSDTVLSDLTNQIEQDIINSLKD